MLPAKVLEVSDTLQGYEKTTMDVIEVDEEEQAQPSKDDSAQPIDKETKILARLEAESVSHDFVPSRFEDGRLRAELDDEDGTYSYVLQHSMSQGQL